MHDSQGARLAWACARVPISTYIRVPCVCHMALWCATFEQCDAHAWPARVGTHLRLCPGWEITLSLPAAGPSGMGTAPRKQLAGRGGSAAVCRSSSSLTLRPTRSWAATSWAPPRGSSSMRLVRGNAGGVGPGEPCAHGACARV